MPYFVYIIQSELDGTYYLGASQNPVARLEKHNRPHKGFTARKQPWKLVYTETFDTLQICSLVIFSGNSHLSQFNKIWATRKTWEQ
jgi:hypothetical protein